MADQGKLNVYKNNGYFIGSIDGNEGDLTGLGDDVSYNSGDLYIQWETADGKVSNKIPLGAFTTGYLVTSQSTSEPTSQPAGQ